MLTEKRIRDAKPGARAGILWDSTVAGLGVKVFPTGRKAFVLSYRVDGKKRLATLGRPSELSLKAVREKAAAELVRIREGEGDPLQRRRDLREAPTVREMVEKFFAEVAPVRVQAGRMSPKTVENYRSQSKRYILPLLGDYKVAKVARADVEQFALKVKGAGPQRNRVLQLLSRLFTEAERWDWRPERSNPVRLVVRAVERPRERVLAPSELTALAAALDALEPAHPFPVNAIRVAAMTGLRISEVLGMAWEQVNLELGRAALETKTGPRVLPLPAAVLELLARLPRVNGCPWVFAGAKRGTAVGYKLTRDVFAKAVEGAGLADVRLHDLRRSLATRLAGAGVNAYILRDVLGHRSLAMSNRYVRAAGQALAEAVEKGAAITLRDMEARKNG